MRQPFLCAFLIFGLGGGFFEKKYYRTKVTTAIQMKDSARASFGYKMNRIESTANVLDIQAENLMAAESRISDVDVAIEMATLTRNQVLAQAGVSMLAQANTMPQMALTLLRG